jgi:hypothetical protein
MEERRSTRVSREINVSAYVVDEQALRLIDEIASRAVADPDSDRPIMTRYSIATKGRETIDHESLDDLVKHLSRAPDNIRSLTLNYTRLRKSGIEVVFSTEGDIRVSGFSNSEDFEFNVNQLQEVLLTLREDYSWPVKMLVFKPGIRNTVNFFLPLLSVLLLANAVFYVHATRVGVNIDPTLIPRGNEYFRKIADALKSNDSNQKLNALLLSQLTGFTNVSDFLIGLRVGIFALAGMTVVALILMGSRKVGERLYPRSFYVFGRNANVYASLQGKRQMWGVAIVIGFVVNVVAGVTVALMLK